MEMTFRDRFEAAHRFLGSASPKCQTPHGHTWWLSLSFKRRDSGLDAQGMIGEFGAVKSWLKQWVEVLDHSYFHNWQDPVVPVLRKEIPDFRGLPFPEDPTTEWIAYLISRKVRTHLAANSENNPQRHLILSQVRIEETPTNSVIWQANEEGELEAFLKERLKGYMGWWDSSDLQHRHIEPTT